LGKVYPDAHGTCSNYTQCSPDYHRSARHWEIYNNRWTTRIAWEFANIRGGTGLIYNNTIENLGGSSEWLFLTDYSFITATGCGAWIPNCMCESDVPIWDSIGRGKDIHTPPGFGGNQTGEPAFSWNNKNLDTGLDIPIDKAPSGIAEACKTYCGNETETADSFIRLNIDYCTHDTTTACNGYDRTSYTPYTCPHPLAGTGTCNSAIAGVAGYSLTGGDPEPPEPTGQATFGAMTGTMR
jgi:hypothetical protein